MELRFRLALVTGVGAVAAHELALRLARAGAGVLVADTDLGTARACADVVRSHRVWSAPVEADTRTEDDVRLLAARVRDLGGVSLAADTVGGPYAALLRDLLDAGPTAPVWLDADTLGRCTGAEAISLLRAG